MKDFDALLNSDELNEFMASVARSPINRRRAYSLAIRASLSKAYHFTLLSRQKRFRSKATHFFMVPSLRGICEDLIVLGFLKTLPSPDREDLVWFMPMAAAAKKVEAQASFFRLARPFQQIVNPDVFDRDVLEERVRSIWRRHGWPKLRRGLAPQIRQLAERQNISVLPVLYEFLYQLTSSMVHFDAHVLFRSGWGPMQKRGRGIAHVEFSPENFHRYYTMFARVYGAYLFILYFELFPRFLRPRPELLALLSDARRSLRTTLRWPEMVTWEELNLEAPAPSFLETLAHMIHAHRQEDRLLVAETHDGTAQLL